MKHVSIHNNALSYMPGRVRPTMSERAEQIAKDLDSESKLRFYENWAVAIVNGYFIFSDGSEIKVPVE